MQGATRLGDQNTGHDDCLPVSLISGSPSVYVDGRPVGRVGDIYAPHECQEHPIHQGHISSGSSSVFANGFGVGRIGDVVDCPATCTIAEGSSTVLVGN